MRRRQGTKRGFALPIVVLLALVAGLAGTVLLEIGGNANLATRRQVDAYKSHHIAVGFKDLVDSFLMLAGADIKAKLEEDGLAFELLLESGAVVRAYLGDAQGALLTDPSALTGPQRRDISLALEHLAKLVPDHLDETMRSRGPVKVSVRSAPRQVIEALGIAMGDEQAAAKLADHIASRLDTDEEVRTQDQLVAAIRDAGFDDESARKLQQYLTTSPLLWRVVIESSPSPESAEITERLEGLIMLGESELNISEGGCVVLEWEDRTRELSPETGR